jgi:hypothetical protein
LYDQLHSAKDENESVSARSVQWKSQTDDTALSQELSSLDMDGSEHSDFAYASRDEYTETPYTSKLDGLDDHGKERTLIAIFPALSPFDVRWTLKKYKGDADRAIDELMTQSFLEESGSRQRGIEAFSGKGVASRPRKGKSKKKRGVRLEEHVESSTADSPAPSQWDIGKKDIEFVADKTGMPLQQVTTMYHQNGGSFHGLVSAIITAYEGINLRTDDPVMQINAFELRQDFPTVPISDLETLIQITHPSLSHARDLVHELVSRPSSARGGIQLSFRHAPMDLTPSGASRPESHNAVHPELPLSHSSASHAALSHAHTRDTAFAQASAAYRKGKSDHLMGGAAAYYSQIGREADAKAKMAQSRAADALVASQSRGTELDLHGVSVKDAVRISRERVESWWFGLGEARLGGGRGTAGAGAGYKIVTGVGRHSEGGKSKLGPAVGKMLVCEGWKVEVGTGHLLVRGKAH